MDNATAGAGIADGFQLTVNGSVYRFEFENANSLGLTNAGHIPIAFTNGTSQLGVANAITNAINNANILKANGMPIVAKTLSGSRVQIDTTGDTTLTYLGGQWNAANGGNTLALNGKYTFQGTAGVTGGNVQVLFEPNANFSSSNVAASIQAAINASTLPGLGITASIPAGSSGRVQLNGPDVAFVTAITGLGLEAPVGVGNDTVKQHEDLVAASSDIRCMSIRTRCCPNMGQPAQVRWNFPSPSKGTCSVTLPARNAARIMRSKGFTSTTS